MPDNFISIANSVMTDSFKTDYLDKMSAPINRRYPIKSLIRHDNGATGNVQAHLALFSDVGGFGSGSIPPAGAYKSKQTNYTLKNLYFRARIDRKSIMLSEDPEGAFMKQMVQAMEGGKNTIDRNIERQLVQGTGTGALGTNDTSSVTDNGGGSYTCLITAASWCRDNFRMEDLLNVGATGTSVFKVTSVAPSTRAVTVLRLDGSDVPVDADIWYRPGSKDNEMQGLRGVLQASSSTKYGISIGDGWQSQHYNASGKPLTEGMLIDLIYNVHDECGDFPDALIVSHTQRKKLYELARDKALTIVDRSVEKDGIQLGIFPHILLEGKEVKIIVSQHMIASEAFLVNTDKVAFRSAGKGEFVQGTDGLLHYEGALNGSDVYSLVWAQYAEIFIHPAYHGEFNSLSTVVEVA